MMASPRTTSVRVLLLARYGELLGADAVEVPVGASATVAEVVDAVRRLPGGDALPARVLCAVNQRQALPADRISAGDEVALLPPMAGG